MYLLLFILVFGQFSFDNILQFYSWIVKKCYQVKPD